MNGIYSLEFINSFRISVSLLTMFIIPTFSDIGKVFDEVQTVCRTHTFRMVLHPIERQFTMLHRHQDCLTFIFTVSELPEVIANQRHVQ